MFCTQSVDDDWQRPGSGLSFETDAGSELLRYRMRAVGGLDQESDRGAPERFSGMAMTVDDLAGQVGKWTGMSGSGAGRLRAARNTSPHHAMP